MALLFLVASLALLAHGSSSPFSPAALPIAVRSPYLNSWLAQGQNPPPANHAWQQFWINTGADTNQVLHSTSITLSAQFPQSDTQWYAAINVDGQSYSILGNATLPNVLLANHTASSFTATRSSFLYQAGPVQVNATFLSPIEVRLNITKQSSNA